MTALLIVTAVIEFVTGLGLLVHPALPVVLLFGVPLDSPLGVTVARVAGAALTSLALACWMARHDDRSPAARGLTSAMVVYNVVVAGLLIHAYFAAGLLGVALWPGVVLHAVMTVWCLSSLRTRRG